MEKYGLIGYPLGHSFSKSYFNQKFEDENMDAVYENYEIASIDALLEIVDSNPELRGLNVTIPYKEKVISYLDNISPGFSQQINKYRENSFQNRKLYLRKISLFTDWSSTSSQQPVHNGKSKIGCHLHNNIAR